VNEIFFWEILCCFRFHLNNVLSTHLIMTTTKFSIRVDQSRDGLLCCWSISAENSETIKSVLTVQNDSLLPYLNTPTKCKIYKQTIRVDLLDTFVYTKFRNLLSIPLIVHGGNNFKPLKASVRVHRSIFRWCHGSKIGSGLSVFPDSSGFSIVYCVLYGFTHPFATYISI